MPECDVRLCDKPADFCVTFVVSGGKCLVCEGHYRDILTGKFTWVEPLTGKPLKSGDEAPPSLLAKEGDQP